MRSRSPSQCKLLGTSRGNLTDDFSIRYFTESHVCCARGSLSRQWKCQFCGVQLRIDLNDMWGFFDLEPPGSSRSMDSSDPLLQKLKGKLNRQRLLFHPDKNGHPEAAETRRVSACAIKSHLRGEMWLQQRFRRAELTVETPSCAVPPFAQSDLVL